MKTVQKYFSLKNKKSIIKKYSHKVFNKEQVNNQRSNTSYLFSYETKF